MAFFSFVIWNLDGFSSSIFTVTIPLFCVSSSTEMSPMNDEVNLYDFSTLLFTGCILSTTHLLPSVISVVALYFNELSVPGIFSVITDFFLDSTSDRFLISSWRVTLAFVSFTFFSLHSFNSFALTFFVFLVCFTVATV